MMNNKEAIEDIYKRYEKIKKEEKNEDTFFTKKFIQPNPVLKYAVVLIGIVIISTSIAIGNNFFNYHSKNNVGYLDKELYTDIKSKKLKNVNMDYCYSNDVGVKISNLLIEDNKMYLVFDFKFEEELEENVNLLELPDLIITNENNDVLYCRSLKKYENYCEEHNLLYLDTNIQENVNYNLQFIEKNQKSIRFLLILNNKLNFQNNKKLIINFNTLSLTDNLKFKESDNISILEKQGDWNLEIKLKEK